GGEAAAGHGGPVGVGEAGVPAAFLFGDLAVGEPAGGVDPGGGGGGRDGAGVLGWPADGPQVGDAAVAVQPGAQGVEGGEGGGGEASAGVADQLDRDAVGAASVRLDASAAVAHGVGAEVAADVLPQARAVDSEVGGDAAANVGGAGAGVGGAFGGV